MWRSRQRHILDMQESQPLAKRLLVVLALDSEPQFCVQPAKATFEPSHASFHDLGDAAVIKKLAGSQTFGRLRQRSPIDGRHIT
jgi:hypothetical protein